MFNCILKLFFLLHSANAEHVDEFFISLFSKYFSFILIYPIIVRAYIAYYVGSHIRRVYTPVSLCEIIRIVRARARQCACERGYVCVRKPELYRTNQIQSTENGTGVSMIIPRITNTYPHYLHNGNSVKCFYVAEKYFPKM